MSNWVAKAVAEINADFQRSADTHMVKFEVAIAPERPIYLKDESTHPSGSLKHRLARSLFLYGLCNGWIRENTTVIEASSGSTAVSEAYFARLLGLAFIAVVPATTSKQKIEQIEFYGGRCHLVAHGECIREASQKLALQTGGHFMDQFTYAERATDWRGNNNIAESLFKQLELEPYPIPSWVVVGAGTGGTSATIGRYIRYFSMDTKLCVVDPEYSAFFDTYSDPNCQACAEPSQIEGIGRPTAEPSFVPTIVDRMYKVPDAQSLGAMLYLEDALGRRCGASTGTNLIGVAQLIQESRARQEATSTVSDKGPIVSLICDSGDRYCNTYFDSDWRNQNGMEAAESFKAEIASFFECGSPLPSVPMCEQSTADQIA